MNPTRTDGRSSRNRRMGGTAHDSSAATERGSRSAASGANRAGRPSRPGGHGGAAGRPAGRVRLAGDDHSGAAGRYLHRGGRTARAGASGSVVTLGHRRPEPWHGAPHGDRGHRARDHPGPLGRGRAGPDHRPRTPSGVPMTITAPPAEQRSRRGAAPRGRRAALSTARHSGVRRSAGRGGPNPASSRSRPIPSGGTS